MGASKLFLVTVVALTLACGMSFATVYTWNASGGTGNWIDASSWTPTGGPPGSGGDALFNQSSNPSVTLPNGNTYIHNVTIPASVGHNYTFSNASATLNIGGDFSIQNKSQTTVAIAPVLNITGQLLGPAETWSDVGNNSPQYLCAVNITANGNTFGGGINIASNRYTISGNSNTFNGGITVLGDVGYFRPLSGVTSGNCDGGMLYITNTGNTFAGAFNLNSQGILWITQNSNFSGVTAINFNGGYLQLDGASNTFSTLAGGFNVASGGLIISSDGSLGSDTNGITLGGTNTFGYLMGQAANSSGNWINRSITLSGMGGVFLLSNYADSGTMNMGAGAVIGGSGMLIKTGMNTLNFLSGDGDNNYSGGTVVASGFLTVGTTTRTLGTGNVTVLPFGTLSLASSGNVDSNTSVLIVSDGMTNKGVLGLSTTSALPAINPASDGVISLAATITPGSEVATALGNGIAGDGTNGYIWIGAASDATYSGASLAPGKPTTVGGNDTYRFSAATNGSTTYGASYGRLTISTGVLNGATDVLVDYGAIYLQAANTFSGTLTVRGDSAYGLAGGLQRYNTSYGAGNSGWITNNRLLGVTFNTLGSGSAIGADGANVKLIGGNLEEIGNVATASAVFPVKGDLSYSGSSIVAVNGTADNNAKITFASLTRADGNSTLTIAPENGGNSVPLGNLGGTEKVLVTGGTSGFVDSNGIVKPYIVAASGINLRPTPSTLFDGAHYNTTGNNGDFLTYDSTNGFTTVSSYTDLPASGTSAASNVCSTAGVTLTGDVSAWDLRMSGTSLTTGAGSIGGSNYTLTLGGGGLIVTTLAGQVTVAPNIKAGSDGAGELVIYNNGLTMPYGDTSTNHAYDWLALNGTITAGSLTLSGPGIMYITANNTGKLTGATTIDQGGLVITNDNQLGATANNLILNGGALLGTGSPSFHHNIEIGPAGGYLGVANSGGALNIYGVISDLDPAHPGTLHLSNVSGVNLYAPATNTGGTVIDCYSTIRVQNGGALGPGPIELLGNSGQNSASGPSATLLIDATTGNTVDMHSSRLTIGPYGMLLFEAGGSAKFGSLAGDGEVYFSTANGDNVLTIGGDNTNADFYGDFYNVELGQFHPGSLVKTGTGAQTLWGRVSYYGATTINGGALTINGIMTSMADNPVAAGLSSDVNINSTGTLNGTGSVQRNVNVNSGGTLGGTLAITGNVASTGGTFSPGAVGTAGKIAVTGNVTMDTNTALNYDLGTASDLITASGNVTLDGTLNVTGGAGFANTTYTLMTYTGTLTDNVLNKGALPSGHNYIIVANPADKWVQLVVTSASSTSYTFSANGNWSASGSWTGGGSHPGAIDTATFNLSSPSNPTVTIDAPSSVQTVMLLNSGTLTMNGAGGNPLTISDAVAVGSGQTLQGSAHVTAPAFTLNGGTLSGTLNLTGNVTSNGGIIAPAGADIGTLTVTGAVISTGTAFNFSVGGGTTCDQIVSTGNMTLAGALTVAATADFSPASGVTVYPLFQSTGGTIGNAMTVNTSALPVSPYLSYTYGLNTGGNEFDLTVTRTAGTFNWTGPTSGGDWSTASNWDAITVPPGANDTASFNATTGDLSVNVSGSRTVEILNVADTTGTHKLTVNGPGSITLNGVTGPAAIALSGGTLTVNGASSSTGGDIGVGAGGVLNGTGSFSRNVNLTSGGTLGGTLHVTGNVGSIAGHLAPGGVGTAGTLTVTGNLTLDHNTVLYYDLGDSGGANDRIDVLTGSLTLDGTLNINGLSGFPSGTFSQVTYTLFNYPTSTTLGGAGLTVDMTHVPDNTLTYNIVTTTAGKVNLVVSQASASIPGDVNHDGVVNATDIDQIYAHFGAHSALYDVDSSGAPIDQADVTYEVETILQTTYGDANLDGYVDLKDFQILKDNWLQPSGWATGDFTGDGYTNSADLQLLKDNWNQSPFDDYVDPSTLSIPEPTTLVLLGLGGLALLRRRRP